MFGVLDPKSLDDISLDFGLVVSVLYLGVYLSCVPVALKDQLALSLWHHIAMFFRSPRLCCVVLCGS